MAAYSSQTTGGMHWHLPASVSLAMNGEAGIGARSPDPISGHEAGRHGAEVAFRPWQQSPPPTKAYRICNGRPEVEGVAGRRRHRAVDPHLF